MKLLAFTVYDEKAECFGVPFFAPAIGIASRMFADLSNNPETNVGKHPEDFTLYHIGHYTDGDAKFENNLTPTFIGKATDYVEPTTTAPAGAIRGVSNA